MKKLPVILIMSAILGVLCGPKQGMLTRDFTSDFDTVRLLDNPDKGWYHHLLDNGIAKYKIRDDSVFSSFPLMDHLYLRLAWSYLEPEEGQFDWFRIDSIINKYVPLGYGISFRISSKETGRYPGSVNQEAEGIQYACPLWVRKAGAAGVVAENNGIRSWTPDWDDPVYLEKLDNFYKAFAAKFDGQPYVRYIDVGSIGEWGEGHTHFSTRVPPSKEEVIANIDVFLKNIKKTKIAVTDDLIYYGKPEEVQKEILYYCLKNGITLRDDSPLVAWYLKNNIDTWSVSHPHFYDPAYLKGPIIFELEHYNAVKRDSNWLGRNGADTLKESGFPAAYIMKKAIETEHSTYIGYHGYCEDWLADNPELSVQLANLCGYWYFPVSLRAGKLLGTGKNNISISWLNKGVAPAYNEYEIVFRLTDKKGRSLDLSAGSSGNTRWLPGRTQTEVYEIDIPSDLKEGKYKLGFRLVSKGAQDLRKIDLGLKNNLFDTDRFVNAGSISVRSRLQ
jgi:hypothetical protein